MKRAILIVAVLIAAASCGKNKQMKVRMISGGVPNMTETFTITQDGKSHTYTEGFDEELILHKGKVQYTLITSSNQVVVNPSHVKIFLEDGQLAHEVVCYVNSTESGEFKLKP